jgi:ATP-dependent DNA ligase
MAASKRSLVGFKEFSGKIDFETNNYTFPKLYKTTDTDKIREWQIYVRLIKEGSKKLKETKEQNWNLLLEDQIPIKQEYLNDDSTIPPGTIAQLWTESGITGMKITRSAPTYIEAKNVGKKNERNPFHQVLVSARGKHLKKIDEGSVEKGKLGVKPEEGINTMYYPMLAKDAKNFKNKIKYPVYIQPKLDGLRCVVFLNADKKNIDLKTTDKKHADKLTYKDVVMYTRQKKEYPFNPSNDNIRKSLLDLLIKNYDTENNESLFLDGEIYQHNTSLQYLSSESRGTDSKGITGEYHLYDLFYPKYTIDPFSERTKFLDTIYSKLGVEDKKFIKLVPTHFVKSQDDNDALYKKYLDNNYEGVMIRSPDGAYAKSSVKKSASLRSKDLLKRKEIFDEEFEVVDFTQGTKGKDVGAIVWVLETKEGKNFNAVPNIPYEDRYELFKDCEKNDNFDKKYKGRMMTIEFRGWSNDKIPLQSKSTNIFRDFK